MSIKPTPKNIVIKKGEKKEIIHIESLNPHVLKNLEMAFDALKNKDDLIGIEELMDFQDRIGNPLTEDQIKETFFASASDGCYQLNFEEFCARMASREFIFDDEVIAAFRHFNRKLKFMDVGQLKFILTQMGDNRFTEEEFEELLRETGYKINDKFNFEEYVKEWRKKLEEVNKKL